MSDQKTDTDQTPAPDLTDQLDRMEEQLIVLRAHTTPPRRNMTLPIAATAGALALLGLLVHRLIVIDHATQQQRSAQTQLSGKVQAALRNAATQRQKTADRLATLDALPKQLSTQLQKRTEAVTRHGELERRMGKLEAELEALRTKLAQSEDSRSRLATQVLFLTQQNRALSLQRELLLKRVGGDVAEGAKPAHSGRSNQTKPMSADLKRTGKAVSRGPSTKTCAWPHCT